MTAMQLLKSLMLAHKDFYKSGTVFFFLFMCLCFYMLRLSSVSTVLAGRSCLCVALSHHLFLARLLISRLIISCPPLSVEVGCIDLIS